MNRSPGTSTRAAPSSALSSRFISSAHRSSTGTGSCSGTSARTSRRMPAARARVSASWRMALTAKLGEKAVRESRAFCSPQLLQQPAQPRPVPGLIEGVQGGQPVGRLVPGRRALPQLGLQGPVALHHQVAFQPQGAGLRPGGGQSPHHRPGREGGAHQHQPPVQPVQRSVPEPEQHLLGQGREIQGQIAAPQEGEQGRRGQRPGAPRG